MLNSVAATIDSPAARLRNSTCPHLPISHYRVPAERVDAVDRTLFGGKRGEDIGFPSPITVPSTTPGSSCSASCARSPAARRWGSSWSRRISARTCSSAPRIAFRNRSTGTASFPRERQGPVAEKLSTAPELSPIPRKLPRNHFRFAAQLTTDDALASKPPLPRLANGTIKAIGLSSSSVGRLQSEMNSDKCRRHSNF